MVQHSVKSLSDNDTRLHPTSGFVAACPKLTELTVISIYPRYVRLNRVAVPLDPTRENAHSAISELVVACRALPDFDTFQIVRIPTATPYLIGWDGWMISDDHIPPIKRSERVLRGQTKDLRDWAIDCLKKPGTGSCKEKGRKEITLRVITFNPGDRSEGVEEYKM